MARDLAFQFTYQSTQLKQNYSMHESEASLGIQRGQLLFSTLTYPKLILLGTKLLLLLTHKIFQYIFLKVFLVALFFSFRFFFFFFAKGEASQKKSLLHQNQYSEMSPYFSSHQVVSTKLLTQLDNKENISLA